MATPRSAKKAARKSSTKSAKAGLIFPVGRVGGMMRRGQYARRIGASGAVYLAAVLEYLTAELLELSVKAAAQSGKKRCRLSPRTVMLAARHDDDIGTLLKSVTLSHSGVVPNISKAMAKKKGGKKGKATPNA
ncbi:putative histone H2A [Leishmania major strain Friedlin]|uniref:Histone H2A n=1 Tax=Leishmania major TaxID=5664 RepID=E9AE35_LEIMA|nr:putative histone H2A [Leishmania major strain Friedlin]CAG9577913.1 histone_H2A_-_putative [Leishmania major strain Friedlin]CBZ12514.1 putative histone H2A [Leishmania major strain Friedlin]|eukprot:XP_003722256.1 putative histone H2A [Leishmania major strain Friedlin]